MVNKEFERERPHPSGRDTLCDGLTMWSDSADELHKEVLEFQSKGWSCWIEGTGGPNPGGPSAFLFRELQANSAEEQEFKSLRSPLNPDDPDPVGKGYPSFRVGEVLTIKGLKFYLASCGASCLVFRPLPGVSVEVLKAPKQNRRAP